jgi:hypothetical protein
MNNELTKAERNELATATTPDVPMGFEDEEASDFSIPRVKVIQTLSPERKEKIAEEGDIINSLTKDKLNDKVFIPVFKFNNNVLWKDRSEGGGILCMARDGKVGQTSDGSTLMCAACKKCEFDNSKTGKDAIPTCVKYINFFGFFAGERMPIILSFSKTSYNEGKKLYSLAKVTLQNMWNYGYTISSKLNAKGNNEWYTPVMTPAGATNDEDREFALNLYKAYRTNIASLDYDMDDSSSATEAGPRIDTDATEF